MTGSPNARAGGLAAVSLVPSLFLCLLFVCAWLASTVNAGPKQTAAGHNPAGLQLLHLLLLLLHLPLPLLVSKGSQ